MGDVNALVAAYETYERTRLKKGDVLVQRTDAGWLSRAPEATPWVVAVAGPEVRVWEDRGETVAVLGTRGVLFKFKRRDLLEAYRLEPFGT